MRKNKEDVEFRISDYDYLSKNTPQAGWAWEFMRRSQEYQNAYESFKFINNTHNNICRKCAHLIDEYMENYKPFFGIDPSEKWSEKVAQRINRWPGHVTIDKTNPVVVVNMKKGTGTLAVQHKPVEVDFLKIEKCSTTHYRDREPSIYGGYRYIEQDAYVINGPHLTELERPMRFLERNHKGKEIPEYHYGGGDYIHIDHPIDLLYQQQGKENILMALIDISAPGSAQDLAKKIEKEIGFWRKKCPIKRQRTAKKTIKESRKNALIGDAPIWKSYLIVYDLVSDFGSRRPQARTKEEVSNILSKVSDFYAATDNVGNHYDNANVLVRGDFRKLLH